jgi:hypothetical protein
VTAPLVYSLVELKQRGSQDVELFEKMLKRKCEQEGDVSFAIDLLMNRTAGIEVADRLSIEHIKESINNLRDITNSTINGGDKR